MKCFEQPTGWLRCSDSRLESELDEIHPELAETDTSFVQVGRKQKDNYKSAALVQPRQGETAVQEDKMEKDEIRWGSLL